MDTDDLNGSRAGIGAACANCGARLATDQRYCLACGTRRGPLPAAVDSTLHEMRATPVAPIPTPEPVAPVPEPRAPFGLQMPTPRVASLLVMAVLSFGVVAGSLTGPGGVESLAHSFVISLPHVTSTPAMADVGSGGGGSGGSGGGGSQQAITETITEPAPSTPAGDTTPAATPPARSSDTGTSPDAGSAAVSLPPIKHVFVVMLSDQGYNQSFGVATGHSYLATTLRKQGELLTDYYGVARSSLASEIALLSGQGPTDETAANCPVYTPIAPTGNAPNAQVVGNGCVYPQTTRSLPSELIDNGNTWRAYIQGIDQGLPGTPKSCRYPASGAADPNQAATATDPYVTHLNPFVYFGSLTSGLQCSQNDVGLDQLATDLKQVTTTANLTYIAPDACHNGSDTPCMPGAPAGLAQSDAFLKTVIPEIEASPAYKQDGMIIVTFDQAPQSGPSFDATSCCDQPTFPNLTGSTGTTTTGTTTTSTTTTGTETTATTATSTTQTTTAQATTPAATTTTVTTTAAARTSPTDMGATSTTTTSGTTTTPCTTTTAPASTTPTTGTTTSGTTTGTTSTGTTTTGTTSTGTTTTGTTTPGITSAGCPPAGTAEGGGQVGALVISRYVKAGAEDGSDTFNHFSLLKTIEDLFSVPKLGYAKDASLPEFDASVFSNYTPS
jgi:hypothetical protein